MEKFLFLFVVVAVFVACSDGNGNDNGNPNTPEEPIFKIDSVIYYQGKMGVGRTYRIDCYPSENRRLLSYNWYFDGKLIENDEYYTLFFPSEIKTYHYKVEVKNVDGSVASKEFSLEITPYDYGQAYWGEKRQILMDWLVNATSYPGSVSSYHSKDAIYYYYLNDKDEFYKGEERGDIQIVSSMIEGLYTNQHLRIFDKLKSKYGNPVTEKIEGELATSDTQKGIDIYNRKLKFTYTFSGQDVDITYVFPTEVVSMSVKYSIVTEHK